MCRGPGSEDVPGTCWEPGDGGLAQPGRAPGLQPGGRRFEPGILHQPLLTARRRREFGQASQLRLVRDQGAHMRAPQRRSGASGSQRSRCEGFGDVSPHLIFDN